MNVPLVVMDPAEAREKAAEYSKVLRRGYDAEYASVEAGLHALARGEKVFSLTQAIVNAPRDDQGRPRLAIGRSDRRECRFQWPAWTRTSTFRTAHRNAPTFGDTLELAVQMDDQNRRTDGHGYGVNVEGHALVPLVPPGGLRLIGGRSELRYHFTLWEVEAWADRSRFAAPDRDPYLCRHLGGDLYGVVFEWDLTEIERLVMYGRRAEA